MKSSRRKTLEWVNSNCLGLLPASVYYIQIEFACVFIWIQKILFINVLFILKCYVCPLSSYTKAKILKPNIQFVLEIKRKYIYK